MPKYFDLITLGDIDIDVNEGTILYLVKVEEGYSIKGISTGLDQLASDPHTRATHYWPVEDVASFLSRVNETNMASLIFPEGKLTKGSLSLPTIQLLGLDPAPEKSLPFSETARKQLKEEEDNHKLTLECLAGMVQEYFNERITSSNRQDLWDAWDELIETGFVKSRAGSAAIAKLKITPAAQANFVYDLTHDVFAFNSEKRAYIESLFSLSKRFPTHFERFAAQVNFEDLLLQSIIAGANSSEEDDSDEESNQNRVSDVSTESGEVPTGIDGDESSSDESENSNQVPLLPSFTGSGYRGRLFSELASTPLTQTRLENKLHEFVRTQFSRQITPENYHAIESAWSEYSPNAIPGLSASSDLEMLNISRRSQNFLVRSLVREYPDFNEQHRAFIRNAFSLNDEFPAHAYRFGVQVGLMELLAEKKSAISGVTLHA